MEKFWFERYVKFAWDYCYIPALKNAVLLTDDLSPVEVWAEPVKLVTRKDLHDYFD
ncbi:hypothetical protein JW935_20715 [candidate division KSB1 bacterium]|nr:hypothetical protein [candidate division KSB1 bacterium]